MSPLKPYPSIEPYDRQWLSVGAPHEIYVEQLGNPDGIPAVFLHGGPGSGCNPSQRRLFDPARFRAVLFDQRGAGLSRPKRCLQDNTTGHLVADLEAIRRALGIARWLVVGGSWGSLLALAYAQAHPDRVTGLVLRAVFLGAAEEVDWALAAGPRMFHPELWRAFSQLLPPGERDDPIAAYGARLSNSDPAIHAPAAYVWHDFERELSVLKSSRFSLPTSLEALVDSARRIPDSPFVESHYFENACFLDPGQLLAEAGRLAGIPGIIIQGRYDMLCPPSTSRALADRWSDAELRLVEGAGHSLSEPGVGEAVLQAIEEMKQRWVL